MTHTYIQCRFCAKDSEFLGKQHKMTEKWFLERNKQLSQKVYETDVLAGDTGEAGRPWRTIKGFTGRTVLKDTGPQARERKTGTQSGSLW